eukprot:262909-Prymnesium_polylepis.1
MAVQPHWVNGAVEKLASGCRRGIILPLPFCTFDMERQIWLAFRTLQSGRNWGKVVLHVTAKEVFPGEASTHVVSGGTSGLGLVCARWLKQNGVDGIVLASRSGVFAPGQQAEWAQLVRGSATTLVECADVAEEADVRLLVIRGESRLPHLQGLWHAAGVLADSLLPHQSASTMCRAYAPKAVGLQLLHTA